MKDSSHHRRDRNEELSNLLVPKELARPIEEDDDSQHQTDRNELLSDPLAS